MIETKYQHWLNFEGLDPELKEELLHMSESDKNDAFYTNVEFGTAGMRGVLGAGTNRLNIYTIRKANLGFAKYIVDHGTEAMERGVAIAYDNRFMSKEFAMESARLLAMYNIKSYVFTSLRPTPELSYAVRHLHCFGGIVITASHNPKEYNGYKLYDENGCQLVPHLVKGVIDHVNEVEDELRIDVTLTKEQESLIHMIDVEVDAPYLDEVMTIQLHPELPKDNFRMVFTPQHGTANESIHELFKRVGYDVVYVEEQCNPDPAFSNTLSPNPEEPKAYELAIDYARRVDADIVLTTDPDADRLGVAVKQDGEYQLMTGNQSAAVLLEYVFSQRKELGLMPEHPVMFNTVVTSDLGEAIATYYGVETEKTLTGFKFIGDKVAKYEKTNEKEFVFGYEESYGCLVKPFVRDKDAMQACMMLAECANYYKKQGKTLIDVLHDLYARHGWYLETQKSIVFKGSEGAANMKAMLQRLRDHIPSHIGAYAVVKYEDYGTQKVLVNGMMSDLEGFPTSEVLKYYLEDGSWIAIRPSGTEPKCKFYYCIKGASSDDVHAKIETLYAAIDELIK
ncbi:MAG: phospho-sugar mutase [Erysipelotrichaceae bacterium]|nr:phospho-sugar mutase [Erysipelotrichaceae bacterium]